MRGILAAILLWSATACAAAAQGPPACSADDDRAVVFYEDVVSLVTSTDPEIVAARDQSYNVPGLPATAVTPVRDARTLGRARGALAAYLGRAPSRCIYVLRLGDSHFAVFDPEYSVGHYQGVFIFDQKWRQVGGWTG